MSGYIPNTAEDKQKMLDFIGIKECKDLFADIPAHLTYPKLDLPQGQSEMEVKKQMTAIAAKNKVFSSIFRGAGAYNHYIPAFVPSIVAKETFLTAYTPYQAEISQGVLQSIFEYQTMICELTGLDVANASIYDGASAAAEAAACCVERKRHKVLVAANCHPQTITTMQTYCHGADRELVVVPSKDGFVDMAALKAQLTDDTACFYFAQPNYFGFLENGEALADAVHAAGAKLIMGCNPLALMLIKSPAEIGADIAVGEGQPLGMPLSFGGPYLGFMAATSALMRKLPGRIVGETVDNKGQRAFVLTLQAREQHIRREKASSNICSNQALCAFTSAVYMATMGTSGMTEAAEQCHAKAKYLATELGKIKGFDLKFGGEFFNEFVMTCPVNAEKLAAALAEKDILAGLPLSENEILWCATEMNSKSQIDTLVNAIKEVCC